MSNGDTIYAKPPFNARTIEIARQLEPHKTVYQSSDRKLIVEDGDIEIKTVFDINYEA